MHAVLSRRALLQQTGRFALAVPALGVVACYETNGLGKAVSFAGPTMGTGYNVSVSAFPAKLDRRSIEGRSGSGARAGKPRYVKLAPGIGHLTVQPQRERFGVAGIDGHLQGP